MLSRPYLSCEDTGNQTSAYIKDRSAYLANRIYADHPNSFYSYVPEEETIRKSHLWHQNNPIYRTQSGRVRSIEDRLNFQRRLESINGTGTDYQNRSHYYYDPNESFNSERHWKEGDKKQFFTTLAYKPKWSTSQLGSSISSGNTDLTWNRRYQQNDYYLTKPTHSYRYDPWWSHNNSHKYYYGTQNQ